MSDHDSYPRLVLLEGPEAGVQVPHEIRIRRGELRVGRGEDQDVVLQGSGVSREHCRLTCAAPGFESDAEETVRVLDSGSHNGTFLNGVPVRDAQLKHGDELSVSGWRFLFLAAPSASAEPSLEPEVSLATRTQALEGHAALYAAPESIVRGQPKARILEGFLRLSSLLGSVVSGESSIEAIRSLLVETFSARSCSLWLQDEGGEEPEGVAGWILPGLKTATPKLLERDGDLRLALVAPLLTHDEKSPSPAGDSSAVGWLVLESKGTSATAWSAEELRALAAFAALIGPELSRAERLRRRLEIDQALAAGDGLIGESAPMTSVKAMVAKVAATPATVLLRGASGTGKEAVARAIHELGDRSSGPFVAINCAAISPHLLESELFGHERGAFTGAVERRVGRLEAAHGGTLLLDEIGEMAPDLQAKLLRVLQDFRFERVGGKRTLEVDVRILSATNRDPQQQIAAGAFREDLYYRLNVVEIELPRLSDRGEDIDLLALYFLKDLGKSIDRRVEGFEPAALEALRRYDWPGNVRELRNVVERALVLGHSDRVTLEDLPERVAECVLPSSDDLAGRPPDFHSSVRQAKRTLIQDALERSNHNVAAAARALRLSPPYLHRLLTQLDLRER